MKINNSLYLLGLAIIATFQLGSAAKNITYGEPIRLQNFYMNNRWLSADAYGDPQIAITVNELNDSDETADENNYEFYIVSAINNDSGSYTMEEVLNGDPKKGDCIRYGESFYIMANTTWYDPWTGEGGVRPFFLLSWVLEVYSEETDLEEASLIWTFRSTAGNGLVNNSENQDPSAGYCIEEDSVVFIQNFDGDLQWLSGSRGDDNVYAEIGDIYESSDEEALIATYQWILSTTLGDGSVDYGVECGGIYGSAVGKWVAIDYSNGDQTISYSIGQSSSLSSSTTTASSWQNSITTSVTAGFKADGASASVSVKASSSWAGSQSSTVSQASSQEKTSGYSVTLGAGVIWQYVYEVADYCHGDDSKWQLVTSNLVVTNSYDEEPCCLPGLALDVNNQHGACYSDSPCTCSDEICNSTRRGLRGSTAQR